MATETTIDLVNTSGFDEIMVADVNLNQLVPWALPVGWTVKDVDLDGHSDALFFFRSADLFSEEDVDTLYLSGKLGNGSYFAGRDRVHVLREQH